MSRQLDHRYCAATEAAQRGRRLLRSQTDEITYELWRIVVSREKRGTGQDCSEADLACCSDLKRAIDIIECDDKYLLARLEAYLLTDLDYDEIGERVGLAPRVVELFGLAYYDVRDLQSANREVAGQIVEEGEFDPQGKEFDFWKRLAMDGSVQGLDEAIALYSDARRAGEAATLKDVRMAVTDKLLHAVQNADPTDTSTLRQLQQLQGRLGEADDDESYLAKEIQNLLESFRYSVGEPDPESMPPMLYGILTQSPYEPNCAETLRAGVGRRPLDVDGLFAMFVPAEERDLMANRRRQSPENSELSHQGNQGAAAAPSAPRPPASTLPPQPTPEAVERYKARLRAAELAKNQPQVATESVDAAKDPSSKDSSE